MNGRNVYLHGSHTNEQTIDCGREKIYVSSEFFMVSIFFFNVHESQRKMLSDFIFVVLRYFWALFVILHSFEKKKNCVEDHCRDSLYVHIEMPFFLLNFQVKICFYHCRIIMRFI